MNSHHRKQCSLYGIEALSIHNFSKRISMGASNNYEDIEELLADRESILGLATKTNGSYTSNEPLIIKTDFQDGYIKYQSPEKSHPEELFVTPKQMKDFDFPQNNKDNIEVIDCAEALFGKKLSINKNDSSKIETDTEFKDKDYFALNLEDDNEPSTVKNIVDNLRDYSIPFDVFSDRCINIDENFSSPKKSDEYSKLQEENTKLKRKNKELMSEKESMRKEYEKEINVLKEKLIMAQQISENECYKCFNLKGNIPFIK